MTATVRSMAPRRPVQMIVDRSKLVGELMDLEALATEAIYANGASLQAVLSLPPGPCRDEMQLAHHDTHDRLVRLLNAARSSAGRYDGVTT